MPSELVLPLKKTLKDLARLEAEQRPRKWDAIDAAPQRGALRKKALDHLGKAAANPLPQRRHTGRNIALAWALSCYDPARPDDFWRHTWGETVFWNEDEQVYHLRYTTRKSRKSPVPVVVDALLPVWLGAFFDAVILQDASRRMLRELRAQAIAKRRPLIAHYDGTRASYRWYSRITVPILGTGAHAMRAILATDAIDLGADGEARARLLLGHRETKHLQKYVAQSRTRKAVAAAHAALGDPQI